MTPDSQGPNAGPDLRCSTQTRNLGEHLAGSATAADHFVLVELPLPWPNKIEDHPVVAAAVRKGGERAEAKRTRVLAVRRADDTDSRRHRIISYRAEITQDGFAGFVGAETDVDSSQLEATLTTVLAGDDSTLVPVAPAVDVLLCTHGRRDRCCGSLGSLLVIELEPLVPDNVRLWRTSHTGGHRFAPTGITFPDGLTWGFVDAPTMLGIIDRSLPPSQLPSHLRGCAGLADRTVQVADATLLARHGWSWLDTPRSHHQTAGGDEAIVIDSQSGGTRSRVRLLPADPIPVPSCAEPIEAAQKATIQFTVDLVTDN